MKEGKVENGVNNLEVDKIYSFIVRIRLEAGRRLFQRLKELGIKYAVYKGAVLSQMLYGNPFIRKSGDTDLLISRENIKTVKTILLREGFVEGRIIKKTETKNCDIQKYNRTEVIYQVSQTHQLAPFVKKTDSLLCQYVNYDINVDIFWGESGIHTDMRAFLDNTVETTICNIQFCKLTPEAEFIAMCMHHYKDLNSIYLLWTIGIRKRVFEEVFLYIKKNVMDLELLYYLCQQYEVLDYVYYCIFKTNLIYRDSLLDKYIEKFETKTGGELLDCFGLCNSERKQWNVDFIEIYNSNNIKKYMKPLLSEEDIRKIEINKIMM